MRSLNYGTGFPVTPYGLAWKMRENAPASLAGRGLGAKSPGRAAREEARKTVFTTAGNAFGYGGKNRFVLMDGNRVRLRTAVKRTRRSTATASPGGLVSYRYGPTSEVIDTGLLPWLPGTRSSPGFNPQASALAGMGLSIALPPALPGVPAAPSTRYNRDAARADVYAAHGAAVGYGGGKKFVFVDGNRTRLRKAVTETLRAKRASVNALSGVGFSMVPTSGAPKKNIVPSGSLVWSKSLRVGGNPTPTGRFGATRLSNLRKSFSSWEKYQGLKGHPTLSSANPRYAAFRGRMYAGMAGAEGGFDFGSILGQVVNTGTSLLTAKANQKASEANSKAATKAAKLQAQMLAAQAAAAQAEADASRAGTTKTALYIAGGVAALVAVGLILRKKRK